MIDKKTLKNLIEKAKEGRNYSYSPYSKFAVGAAILTNDGKYTLGCNIENASYGLSNCAERTAMFKLISNGYKKDDVIAICVIADTTKPVSPCGACRQVMSELLGKNMTVVLANMKDDYKICKVSDLLPYEFNEGDL